MIFIVLAVIGLAIPFGALAWLGSFHQTQAKETRRELAECQRERDAWMECARQSEINRSYYQGLVVQCGEAIGPAAKTTDAGEFVPDVLAAKVPELVEGLVARERARS